MDSNVESMCVSESNEQGELRSLFAVKLRSVCSDQMAPPNVIFFLTFLTFSLVQHIDWSAFGLKPVMLDWYDWTDQWYTGAGFLWKYMLFHFSYMYFEITQREGVKKIFLFHGQADHKGWGGTFLKIRGIYYVKSSLTLLHYL